MKRKNLDKMINLIDDDILEEANPQKMKKTGISKFGWAQIIAVVACLILTLNMAIMIPVFLSMNGDEHGGENITTDVIQNDKNTETQKPNSNTDTEIDTPTDTDTEVETDTESDKVERPQNITNIYINIPGKDTHVITLSSPLLGAPSEYDKIVSSMQAIAGGRLDGAFLDKNEDLSDNIEGTMKDESTKEEQGYKETTDNQVSGIIEGDLIKRWGNYIYYLAGNNLRIYNMNGNSSSLISQVYLKDYIDEIVNSLRVKHDEPTDEIEESIDSSAVREMFLSKDGKTVTVVVELMVEKNVYKSSIKDEIDYIGRYLGGYVYFTTLISLNVEDPHSVYLKDVTTLSGSYESARLTDGEFLVFTRFAPTSKELIIPQYSDGEGFKYIPYEKIYSPSEYKCAKYLLSFKIDDATKKVKDSSAFASFDGEIYVTNENIYVTRQYRGNEKLNIVNYPLYKIGSNEIVGYGTKYDVYSMVKTDILRIDYSKGVFEAIGVATVNGYIKDRYSLSENGEYLYVVTTDERIFTKTVYDEGEIGKEEDWIGYRNTTSANVFIVDKGTMEKVNGVERFAPIGETVRSVRFDGDTAYVCTAVQITDPVFFIDLRDPQNITYRDTGTIPGFSTQLIQLPNGVLLGIGTDGSDKVKIETYRLGENNTVDIVATCLINGSYSTDYKSHYINRELGLIGLGIYDSSQKDMQRYVLLKYQNGEFKVIVDVTLRGGESTKRAIYDEATGYFYMVSNTDFAVYYIGKLKK